jgi:hypothetical protein
VLSLLQPEKFSLGRNNYSHVFKELRKDVTKIINNYLE